MLAECPGVTVYKYGPECHILLQCGVLGLTVIRGTQNKQTHEEGPTNAGFVFCLGENLPL